MYAQWELNTVTVTFNANGGTGTMATQEIPINTATNLIANVFAAPSGYAFSGWNTAVDRTGSSYTDQQTVTLLTDLTLYAQWYCPVYSNCTTCNGTKCAAGCTGSYFTFGVPAASHYCIVCGDSGITTHQCVECGIILCTTCYNNSKLHYCLACSGSGSINTCTHSKTEAHYYE